MSRDFGDELRWYFERQGFCSASPHLRGHNHVQKGADLSRCSCSSFNVPVDPTATDLMSLLSVLKELPVLTDVHFVHLFMMTFMVFHGTSDVLETIM